MVNSSKSSDQGDSKPGITTAYCICGVGVEEVNRKNGMYVFVCRGCNTEYGYPANDPRISALKNKEKVILMPGFNPATDKQPDPPKNYHCKGCGSIITKERALSSYNEHGKALCADCQGGS